MSPQYRPRVALYSGSQEHNDFFRANESTVSGAKISDLSRSYSLPVAKATSSTLYLSGFEPPSLYTRRSGIRQPLISVYPVATAPKGLRSDRGKTLQCRMSLHQPGSPFRYERLRAVRMMPMTRMEHGTVKTSGKALRRICGRNGEVPRFARANLSEVY